MAQLEGKVDHYNGFIIDETKLPSDPSVFHASLKESLSSWRSEGRRGIWLKIPTPLATHVPLAASEGFEFHHAEAGYVMMTNWLPGGENTLPPNASHQVGVGSFVLNSAGDKCLMVQEKNGPLKGKQVWKMPTGLLASGEDLPEAALREVKEETGVTAVFERVLCFRQLHGVLFGKSDLFFVIALRATPEGEAIQIQESEIEAAAWVPLHDYFNNPFYEGRPLYQGILKCCEDYAAGRYHGQRAELLKGGFRPRLELLVHGRESDTAEAGPGGRNGESEAPRPPAPVVATGGSPKL